MEKLHKISHGKYCISHEITWLPSLSFAKSTKMKTIKDAELKIIYFH